MAGFGLRRGSELKQVIAFDLADPFATGSVIELGAAVGDE
jgi:hypothetical protein